MAFWQWSKTAANNGNSDPTINYQEGEPPALLNDAGRAGMARLAEYRDDQAGSLLTGGTSTAYTISTNQVFDTLAHLSGQKLKIRFNQANGVAPTLNADGLGAKSILTSVNGPPPAGFLATNSIWDVTYDNSIPCFILSGVANSYTPIGAVMDFAGSSAPSLWLLCFGQAISRTTYAALFAVLGTTYGVGDGSTTFNLPDYRGRIGAGVDNMGGSAASRIGSVSTDSGTITGTTLGSTGGSSTHAQTSGELATHSHPNSLTDPGHTHALSNGQHVVSFPNFSPGGTSSGAGGVDDATVTDIASATTGITITNANAGSGAAMAWLQPTIMINKIIFAGV